MRKSLSVLALALFPLSLWAQGLTLTLVTDDYPPYEYTDQAGNAVGMDVELLQAAAQKAGITLKIDFYPWERCKQMAANGDADGLFSLGKTEERLALYYYPATVLSTSRDVFFANDLYKGNPKTIAELEGQTVGTLLGYEYTDEFLNNLKIKKLESPTQEAVTNIFIGKRVGIILQTELVGLHQFREAQFTGYRVLPIKMAVDEAFVAFSKKSKNGKAGFEKLAAALAALQKSGELDKIRAKYLK